ncbi:MAG: helix-turn-helix domain-containing protein [Clostridia bacterium]|nr:helix-turn-helix domain-containing protein [Clostridia bacterium]
MDAKITGSLIASLRKSAGLTQAALAEKLNVSDKAVSKWESGLGYPEITQFPSLAALFGVSVDYLLTGDRNGITIAGSIIVDTVKNISTYPEKGMLSIISGLTKAAGGCAPNTAIDLTRIDRSIPVSVVGCVGDDDNGNFITGVMQKNGVNTGMITVTSEVATSFSDVMSLQSGERTFFSFRGANDAFGPEHINLSTLKCKMFHIGYILMLAKFDAPDSEYGTVMARLLHDVRERGIKTSIDVVSSSDEDYKATIIPALKHTDYAIMNEVESGMLTDLPAYDGDGNLLIDNIRKTMEFMAECGVREKVIIHCKQCGFCLDVITGEFTVVPSLEIPKELIKGSVGAGDAYCAGCLYALYNGFDDKRMLEFASAAAACNLFSENATDSMRSRDEIEKMEQTYGRKKI